MVLTFVQKIRQVQLFFFIVLCKMKLSAVMVYTYLFISLHHENKSQYTYRQSSRDACNFG